MGAPLLYLYILSITKGPVSWVTVAVHLGVYVLYITVFYLLKEKEDLALEAINGHFPILDGYPKWMRYYATPLAVSGLVYCFWDLLLLKKHRQTLVTYFSYHEKIHLNWVRYMVYVYLMLFLITSVLIFGATQFQIFPLEKAFAFVGISLCITMVAFGFYAFRQTAVFSNLETPPPRQREKATPTSKVGAYAKSGLKADKIADLALGLTKYMEGQKPYLNERLNLAMLAGETKIAAPYLSQIINQHFKMNFYDFINRYRVVEAKERLTTSDFDHLSLLGIAYDCGFKSKSSFNRYFKKHTGMSPSDFKKERGS